MTAVTGSAQPSRLALVFPGMGPSSHADLGRYIMVSPHARRLRRAADDVLGYPLMDLYRTAGENYSEYSQVAFLISCVALAEWAESELGIEPEVCSGPSFGEKSAVAYAGSLDFAETVLLTVRLARCEEEYFRSEYTDVVTQSIARTPEPALREILADMAARNEWHDVSCLIDEDFFMVSMRKPSLERFTGAVRAAGGLPLFTMQPPMHSSAFGLLRQKVAEDVLGDFQFADPRLPIVADQDGAIIRTAADVKSMLLDSIVRPVHWPDTLRSIQRLGIGKIYIAGPDALFGRVRCATDNFDIVTVNQRMALRPKRAPRYTERISLKMWDEQFETLLRSRLPFLDADEQLLGDLDLREFGLDSLGVVDLLVSLEETYDVRFVDDALSMESFSAPAVLWDTLSQLIGSAV
jgi:[acyl-carrier-protein] S-malonyltransferase